MNLIRLQSKGLSKKTWVSYKAKKYNAFTKSFFRLQVFLSIQAISTSFLKMWDFFRPPFMVYNSIFLILQLKIRLNNEYHRFLPNTVYINTE